MMSESEGRRRSRRLSGENLKENPMKKDATTTTLEEPQADARKIVEEKEETSKQSSLAENDSNYWQGISDDDISTDFSEEDQNILEEDEDSSEFFLDEDDEITVVDEGDVDIINLEEDLQDISKEKNDSMNLGEKDDSSSSTFPSENVDEDEKMSGKEPSDANEGQGLSWEEFLQLKSTTLTTVLPTSSLTPITSATDQDRNLKVMLTPLPEPKPPARLKVGPHYVVKRNQISYPAEVVKSRRREGAQNIFEYYVHYTGQDKRLDEWLPKERIMSQRDSESNKLAPGGVGQTMSPSPFGSPDALKMTRYQKRMHDEINHISQQVEEMNPTAAALEREHENFTKVKNIDKVQFGLYDLDAWYFSPYPDKDGVSKLYVCQGCLIYTACVRSYQHHWKTCHRRQPPGNEIYRKGTLSIYEIDGKQEELYCQNLCLLSKLFLDHKVVHFGVHEFVFYVLCEVDRARAHLVGYFSKEKCSLGNNVACILTLPHHQRKGYGSLMIQLSYELSKAEGIVGSPEKPLSDLGKCSYRSYWTWVLLDLLRKDDDAFTIKELSNLTSITEADIISTLKALNMVKFWKGQNVICVTAKLVDDHIKAAKLRPPRITIDLACLRWAPPLKSPSKKK